MGLQVEKPAGTDPPETMNVRFEIFMGVSHRPELCYTRSSAQPYVCSPPSVSANKLIFNSFPSAQHSPARFPNKPETKTNPPSHQPPLHERHPPAVGSRAQSCRCS